MGKAKQAIFAWAETQNGSQPIKGQQIVAHTQSEELSDTRNPMSDVGGELRTFGGMTHNQAYDGTIRFQKMSSRPWYILARYFDARADRHGQLPYAHILMFDDATFKETEYNPMSLKDLLMHEFDPRYQVEVDPTLVGGTLPEIEFKGVATLPERKVPSFDNLNPYKPLLLKTVEILRAEPTKKLAVFLDDMTLHNDFVEATYLMLPLEKRKEIAFRTHADFPLGHLESLAIVPLTGENPFLARIEAEKQGYQILAL